MALSRMTKPQNMKKCIHPASGSRNSLVWPKATDQDILQSGADASKRFSFRPIERNRISRLEL